MSILCDVFIALSKLCIVPLRQVTLWTWLLKSVHDSRYANRIPIPAHPRMFNSSWGAQTHTPQRRLCPPLLLRRPQTVVQCLSPSIFSPSRIAWVAKYVPPNPNRGPGLTRQRFRYCQTKPLQLTFTKALTAGRQLRI